MVSFILPVFLGSPSLPVPRVCFPDKLEFHTHSNDMQAVICSRFIAVFPSSNRFSWVLWFTTFPRFPKFTSFPGFPELTSSSGFPRQVAVPHTFQFPSYNQFSWIPPVFPTNLPVLLGSTDKLTHRPSSVLGLWQCFFHLTSFSGFSQFTMYQFSWVHPFNQFSWVPTFN